MRIYGQKIKQVKNGVYKLSGRGEIIISDYRYSLPLASIVVPEKNMVFTFNKKGTYAWKYSPCRDSWQMWKFSKTKERGMDIRNAFKITDSKAFDMMIERPEGNKALVMLPKNYEGKTVICKEWRYFTYFFRDIVRTIKCASDSNADIYK